jgi:hypothetical protein
MKIITNNRPRPLLYGCELTPEEAAEFDYMSPDDLAAADFVRYKGRLYDVGEFLRAPESLPGWDGHMPNSYFSGTVIRLDAAGDYAVIGRYFT